VLERGGLLLALQWLVAGFSKRSGIVVTFEPGERAGERFRPSVELALYRIAQEALTNVLRHSGSRTARVILAAGAADVRLTVSDEGAGRGRDPCDREGVGLASMRARVRSLGGRLDLEVRPVGMALTAVVPRSGPRGLRRG
jgi:signal transduction histidine kinase